MLLCILPTRKSYLCFSAWLICCSLVAFQAIHAHRRGDLLISTVAVLHIPMTSSGSLNENKRTTFLVTVSVLQLLVEFRSFSFQHHASPSPSSPRRILILLGLLPEILVLIVSEAGLWTIPTDSDQWGLLHRHRFRHQWRPTILRKPIGQSCLSITHYVWWPELH